MPGGAVVEVSTLIGLGLEEPTARLWQGMLRAPRAGVEDLVALLGMTETDVRAGLDALADLALVRASRQAPGVLVPVATEVGLSLLLRRQEEELAAHRAGVAVQCDRLTQALAENLPADGSDPSGLIEHLIGVDAIQTRFEQLAFATAECADTLMPGGAIPAAVLEEARPLDAEVLGRGVRMRMLYQEAIRNDAATIGYARDMAALGAVVRTAPVLPQRLFLCDRRIALVPLDPADPLRGAACVSAPGIIASLIELFEYAWVNAAPLDVGHPVDAATGLSDTERELLGLLATGATDETVAKKLGVSLRTVRRIMADLMARLEASSRFEAGIKAAKRGWL